MDAFLSKIDSSDSGVPQSDQLLQPLLVEILARLNALSNKVDDIHQLLAVHGEKIEKCAENITTLQQENVELHIKVSALESKIEKQVANAYEEMKMRIEREKNVIIWGVPEGGTDAKVEEIIETLVKPSTVNFTGCFRLGKPHPKRTRPIKVEFKDKNDATLVLRNRKKAPTEIYPNLKIKNDRTPTQIKELSALYKEVEIRNNNGENVIIRYFNGIPKITVTERKSGNKRDREESESPDRRSLKKNQKNGQ